MGGILTHVSISIVGFLIISLIFYKSPAKWVYGLAFVVGHLIMDTLGIISSMIKIKTIRFWDFFDNQIYWNLNSMFHNVYIWIFLFILVLVVTFVLLKIKKIKIKTFKEIFIADIIFLLGVIIHLMVDYFVIETNRWI